MKDLFDLPFEDDDGGQSRADDRPSAPAAPSRAVVSVSQLNARLRDALETEFFEIWVEGELSSCKVWNNGHLYFTLKDSASQVRGFMFRSTLRYLKFKPEDGLRVIVRGKITVYEPKGEYQLLGEHMEPHGLGRLQLAFDQLKKRLQQEGLFDAARKRPLPALPRKIGIVTSLEGAAIRDIINVLTRRHRNVQILIRPARVQGEGAAVDIARGIKAIGRATGIDVVIVGRGGGSIEDLWAFNEEIVARAIALCPVPVISAVGHETDTTIADFVADVRAPTPSAAAELVIAGSSELLGRIDRLNERLSAAASHRIARLARRVHAVAGRPAFAGFPGRVVMRGRHVAEMERRLAACDLMRRLEAIRTRLATGHTRLSGAMSARRHLADQRLGERVARLESLSPLAVLGRGYAVCWNEDRTAVVRDARLVAPGDGVRVTLARGELHCEIRETHEDAEVAPNSPLK